MPKIVRVLFGDINADGRFEKCRKTVENDIEYCCHNRFQPEYVSYTFGEDNHKQLLDLGIDSRLVDKKPIAWDLNTQMMRHKLEAFKIGVEEFEEILLLDWDVLPVKPIPDSFWDTLRNKGEIQAILRKYRYPKCDWRDEDKGYIPCAAFVYINNKNIPDELLVIWNRLGKIWSEEVVLAKYLDDVSYGWRGIDYYWDNFEPDFFELVQRNAIVYPSHKRQSKNKIFHHFHDCGIRKGLKRIHDKQELHEWEK